TLLGLILLPVHQPPGNILGISFAEPSLLGPILTACAAIFLGIELNVLKLVGRNHFVSLLALLVIGIMIGLGLLFAFPEILDGPAAGLTPDERILVFKEHAESWPLYKIALSPLNYIALSMPCILALISGLVAVAKAPTHRRRTLYLSYLGFAVLAGGLGQYISRFYHHALTTACPWLLWLWQRVRDRVVQTPKRCLILFAAFIAIGPLWMLIIPAFETHVLILKQLFLFPAKQQMLAAPCNIVPFGDYLNAHYSKDTKIIVPGADSSRMLYYSDLKIDFLNNYPSQNKFIDNQIFFGTQDQSMSKAIAIAHGFDLIAICPATMKPAPLAAGEEPMMFERMQLGPLPIWLKPVNTGLPGSYLLFQVDKTELMK
ncbi:MAG TPA: hypothetical protein VFR09_02415, partial [Alphaproteobacteria bacterium]|nr:hypothetical protein [Alphaproteobacteria bacterium]